MTLKENLLVTVSEECNEIGQAVSKTLRFGDTHENLYDIMCEFYQLCAVVDMCQEAGILPRLAYEDESLIASEKKRKVRMYQNVSRELGTLKEADSNGQ